REKAIAEELAKLDEMRKKITSQTMELDDKQQEQLGRLVETLEKMSPKNTAKMLGDIDDKLAVEAMTRMSTDRLAKILNVMEPAKSAKLSELLALGKRAPA